jgi:hypothetical protein
VREDIQILLRILLMFLLLSFCAPGVPATWNSAFFVSLRYNKPMDRIHPARMPLDCTFWASPLGLKACSYAPLISEINGEIYVRWEKSMGWSQ